MACRYCGSDHPHELDECADEDGSDDGWTTTNDNAMSLWDADDPEPDTTPTEPKP